MVIKFHIVFMDMTSHMAKRTGHHFGGQLIISKKNYVLIAEMFFVLISISFL